MKTTQKCLDWLRKNTLSEGGILIHSSSDLAYPEVTGYLIPTLLDYEELNSAKKALKWLLNIQHSDGSFTDPAGTAKYIFDTGQVLRGFLAMYKHEPKVLENINRACNYLINSMQEDGKKGFGRCYPHMDIAETILLYVISPLKEALILLSRKEELIKLENSINYYTNHPDFLNINNLTHFLSYELEALIDLEKENLAIPILDKLKSIQREDGSIRGNGNSNWVCTPGLAQLAVCWYKINDPITANKAMQWLEKKQNKTGGFFGSYGKKSWHFSKKSWYFPKEEISWAVKYYLDAFKLQNNYLIKKAGELI